MTRLALLLAITLLVPACAPVRATSATAPNPLVGSWTLERYVDTPEGGAPIYAFGEHPSGLGKFTRTLFAQDLRRTMIRTENIAAATGV